MATFYTLAEVMSKTGLAKKVLVYGAQHGLFPDMVKEEDAPTWRKSDIDEWLDNNGLDDENASV